MIKLCLAVILLIIGTDASAAGRKIALVVANSDYAAAGKLKNPANDAIIVADALRADNFDVVNVQSNLSLVQFQRQLIDFSKLSAGADIALIYYAGHGILSNGVNYMIPVDAELREEDRLQDEALSVERISYAIHDSKVRIVIFDACRDNPFQRGWTQSNRGTVVSGLGVTQIDGELVIFSAAAGQKADDGNGANSPFALALAKRLVEPGLPVQLLGNGVRDDVKNATGDRQIPFFNGSLSITLAYLSPQKFAVAADGRPINNATLDAISWQSAANADTIDAYTSYVQAYPKGHFSKLAVAAIRRLHAIRASNEPSADSPNFVSPNSTAATAALNNAAKRVYDDRDSAQEQALADYHRQIEDSARMAATLNDEYARKVSDFHGQQSAYEAQKSHWQLQVKACKKGQTKLCAGVGKGSIQAILPWKEALTFCLSGDGDALDVSCQGPFGKEKTILGTAKGAHIVERLCGKSANVRDLGMAQGNRVYACGYGLNPYRKSDEKTLDVADALGITDVSGRQDFYCTNTSAKYCRILTGGDKP